MKRKEFDAKISELHSKHDAIKAEEDRLREEYGRECLERSGYRVGDRVEIDGVRAEITGVDFAFYGVYAQLKKVKKDGTVSFVSCKYRLRLKEDR